MGRWFYNSGRRKRKEPFFSTFWKICLILNKYVMIFLKVNLCFDGKLNVEAEPERFFEIFALKISHNAMCGKILSLKSS